VREIAELHNAKVSVIDGAGGQGALFRVQFAPKPQAS
jgi:signal transduction histidine kinase